LAENPGLITLQKTKNHDFRSEKPNVYGGI
jgi:hypothetical protein